MFDHSWKEKSSKNSKINIALIPVPDVVTGRTFQKFIIVLENLQVQENIFFNRFLKNIFSTFFYHDKYPKKSNFP